MRSRDVLLQIGIDFIFLMFAVGLQPILTGMLNVRPTLYWSWVAWVIVGVFLLFLTFKGNEITAEESAETSAEPLPVEQHIPEPVIPGSQESIVAANQLRNFSTIDWITSRNENGELDASLKRTAVQRTAPRVAEAGALYSDVAVTKPDGTQLLFRYTVLSKDKSWKKGRSDLFEGESPQGIRPLRALNKSYLAGSVRKSIHTVCIGLASTEYRPDQRDTSTKLSDDRVIRLCSALIENGYIAPQDRLQTAVAMGLGEFQSEKASSVPAELQRAAVVVSIADLAHSQDIEIFDALKASAKDMGVFLDQYKRSDGNLFSLFNLRGSEFTDSESDLWNMTEGSHFIRDTKSLREAD
jgi:hypothetical protein